MPKAALGVLISGSGTNLQAIIDAIEAGRLAAEIKIVVSNRPGVLGLERAEKHGIPTAVIPHRGKSREEFDAELVEILKAAGVELAVMAGFMRVVTAVFLRAFPHRVMNIHPAILPSFPGVDAQGQAFAAGVKLAGCSVMFIDEGVDTGPVIIQAAVPVLPDDTADTLRARILRQEHRILPEAIRLYAEGKLEWRGDKLVVQGAQADAQAALVNPPIPE